MNLKIEKQTTDFVAIKNHIQNKQVAIVNDLSSMNSIYLAS